LTATATEQGSVTDQQSTELEPETNLNSGTVRDDVIKILGIRGCEVFRSPCDRPNLYYEVRDKPATLEGSVDEIVGFIKGFEGKTQAQCTKK